MDSNPASPVFPRPLAPPRPLRARVFLLSGLGTVALIERRNRQRRYWTIPGGGIEFGETPHQAATREVLEELGLRVDVQEVVGQIGRQLFFVAHIDQEYPLVLGGPEIERQTPDNSYHPHWVRLDQVRHLRLRPEAAKQLLSRL